MVPCHVHVDVAEVLRHHARLGCPRDAGVEQVERGLPVAVDQIPQPLGSAVVDAVLVGRLNARVEHDRQADLAGELDDAMHEVVLQGTGLLVAEHLRAPPLRLLVDAVEYPARVVGGHAREIERALVGVVELDARQSVLLALLEESSEVLDVRAQRDGDLRLHELRHVLNVRHRPDVTRAGHELHRSEEAPIHVEAAEIEGHSDPARVPENLLVQPRLVRLAHAFRHCRRVVDILQVAVAVELLHRQRGAACVAAVPNQLVVRLEEPPLRGDVALHVEEALHVVPRHARRDKIADAVVGKQRAEVHLLLQAGLLARQVLVAVDDLQPVDVFQEPIPNFARHCGILLERCTVRSHGVRACRIRCLSEAAEPSAALATLAPVQQRIRRAESRRMRLSCEQLGGPVRSLR